MDRDSSLYKSYLEGDEGAFDLLMESLFYRTVLFADSFVRDVHTAEDIAMDAFSELIARPKRFNFRASLKTYVFTMVRSRALDHLRRRGRLQIGELSEAEGLADDRAALEDAVIKDERRKAVAEAMAKLPDDMRSALYLVYFEGLSYKEAAGVLDKDPKWLDNLLQRAKKKLREILGEEGAELI